MLSPCNAIDKKVQKALYQVNIVSLGEGEKKKSTIQVFCDFWFSFNGMQVQCQSLIKIEVLRCPGFSPDGAWESR